MFMQQQFSSYSLKKIHLRREVEKNALQGIQD
jgi:hypothetical protein